MDDILTNKQCQECGVIFQGTPQQQHCSYCAILAWAKEVVRFDQERADLGLPPIDYVANSEEIRKDFEGFKKKLD